MPVLKKKQMGFTLIEIILVMTIISLISVVVGRIMFEGLTSFQEVERINEDDWQAFSVLEHFNNDLHQMRTPQDISIMTATQLTFIDTSNTSVQYQLSGTNVLRNSVMVARGVSSFALSYLDKTGTVTATAANVRYVALNFSVTQNSLTLPLSILVGVRGIE